MAVYCFLDCEMITDIQKIFQVSLIFTTKGLNIVEVVHYNVRGVKFFGHVKALCQLKTAKSTREFQDVAHIKTVLPMIAERIANYKNVIYVGKSIQTDLRVINRNCERMKLPTIFTDTTPYIDLDCVDRIKLCNMASGLSLSEQKIKHKLKALLKRNNYIKIGTLPIEESQYHYHNSLFDSYAGLLVTRVYKLENIEHHLTNQAEQQELKRLALLQKEQEINTKETPV